MAKKRREPAAPKKAVAPAAQTSTEQGRHGAIYRMKALGALNIVDHQCKRMLECLASGDEHPAQIYGHCALGALNEALANIASAVASKPSGSGVPKP